MSITSLPFDYLDDQQAGAIIDALRAVGVAMPDPFKEGDEAPGVGSYYQARAVIQNAVRKHSPLYNMSNARKLAIETREFYDGLFQWGGYNMEKEQAVALTTVWLQHAVGAK